MHTASGAGSFSSVQDPRTILTRGQLATCNVDALRTLGIPEEIIRLVCHGLPSPECPPAGPGIPFGELVAHFEDPAHLFAFEEDPDARPYIWDLEDLECRS